MIKKKGVSEVVATVLLIALTLVIVSIVWLFVNNLVKDKIKTSESCGVMAEVELNPLYTCYNKKTGDDEVWFSINVGDVDKLEDIKISISGQGTSSVFNINESLSMLLNYPDRTAATGIPGKNQGLTYIHTLPSSFTQTPDLLQIAPVINGEQCEISSSINQLDGCSSLA